MEYSDDTSTGRGPDENSKLIEMGEIGLFSQVSAPFNHCADDSEETHFEKCIEKQNSSKCLADDNANNLVDTSTGNSNLTYAPAPSAKQTIAEFAEFNYELQQAYRILRDLMSEGHKGVNSPFMDSIEAIEEDVDDYFEVITKPMWLKKVRHKFLKREYNNITEVIADIRLILENCYRYYGPDSPLTKKALRLEQILEQKLALLPRELRDKTTLEITSGRPVNDDLIATRRRSTRQTLEYTSILLNLVRHEKAERNRELKKKLTEGRKAEKEEKEKEVLAWEDELLEEPIKTQMKAMWELPMIGHFFYLCQTVLNMPEVSQFELERILVMPRASSLLPKIMTSLLSNPTQRASLDRNPPMPYKVWQSRLQNRIQSWYKILHARENRGDLVFQQLGIEARFFKILGTQNPLNEKRFHELTFHQRIWCVKGLCDYILYNHRTVQDALNDQLMDDMREYVLGCDSVGNIYLHFPQFCGQDLRIYKQRKCNKPPSPGCWGAPYTKKRKSPKTEKIRIPPTKKQKTAPAKPQVQHVSPSSEPPVAFSCTRRSPRFSKNQQVQETEPSDEAEDTDASEELTSEGEQSTEESDSEADDDDDLEPDITKFELVVDSVESLRTFMEKFRTAFENMRNRKERQPYSRCEAELYRRLKNLLVELEPWESKLQKSAQRIRNRLRREWEDFVEDEEEIEDIWGSDGESEDGKSSVGVSTSGNSNEETSSSCDKAVIKQERPATRARSAQKTQPVKQEEISTEELLNQDDDSCEYLTRGRLQQIRIMRSMPKKAEREIRVNGNNRGQQNLLIAHSRHNTTSEAKELYAWETLRQILVPAANSTSMDAQAGCDAHNLSNVNNLNKPVLSNTNEAHQSIPTSSPEKQNLIHAKLDMLGAMQAAMAKKPDVSTLVPKQLQLNSSTVFPKACRTTKNNVLPRSRTTQRLSQTITTSAKGIPKYNAASPNAVLTKQQLSELSSVATNTTNLKRLLERINKVPPTSVISTAVSSPDSREPSTQPKAQVMLFPMVDAEGKSVVYRVTSNKTLSSIPGVDIKKIALALATSTTASLPPGFTVEKISVEGDLLSNVSQGVLAKSSLANKPTVSKLSSPLVKSAVGTAKQVPKGHAANAIPQVQAPISQVRTNPVSSAKVRCVTSTASNSLTLNSLPQQVMSASSQNVGSKIVLNQPPVKTETTVQQQMLLVPVQNQHGQTVYLQIPAQSAEAISAGKPAVTSVTKSPSSPQSQAVRALASPASRAIPSSGYSCATGNAPLACGSPISLNKVAPSVAQRLIPALSSKRQNTSFLNALLVSNPPSLAPLSKPKTPNPKLITPQHGDSLVTSGLSPIASNVSSAANTLICSPKNAEMSFTGTFALDSLTNKKSTGGVNSVLPIASRNGTTPTKNPVAFIQASEQVTPRKIEPSVTTQIISTSAPVIVAPSTIASPMGGVGVVATVNPALNVGIMPASVGQTTNHNNKLTAMPQLEYSPDALSASVASLVSKNPALAATVQKYMQSGHRVVIAQQGNQLVLQAYPPQVNVSMPQVTAPQLTMAQKSSSATTSSQVVLPQKQVQMGFSPSTVALPQHEHPKNPIGVPAMQDLSTLNSLAIRIKNNLISKVSSPNVTQTLFRPPTVIQSLAPSSLRLQAAPGGALNQALVPNVMQNVVCQTVVSTPNSSGVLANSAVITSTTGSTGQTAKHVLPTPVNTTQHKLVMIRDTTSDKQTLGILLDNGQVVPLNASISFTNPAIS